MKRRIFKQFLSGILGIILLLSLAGCGQSTSNSKPDDTMEAFYDLIIKQDTTSMTDLGIDNSEASDTLKTYQTSMISTLQKSFKNAGVTITKKQANEIYKAISSKLSSLDHKITVTGQDKKNKISIFSNKSSSIISEILNSFIINPTIKYTLLKQSTKPTIPFILKITSINKTIKLMHNVMK